MKNCILPLVLLFSATRLLAQNEADALRYSQTQPAGTARALGMGGAFSAVGADLSAATLNPAGIGLYRKSTFVFSPSYQTTSNESDYLDSTATTSLGKLTLGSWGFAFNQRKNEDNPENTLHSLTFAFGQNQVANYNRRIQANGYNTASSITDYFATLAQGSAPSALGVAEPVNLQQLAYNTYAIFPTANNNTAYFGAAQTGIDSTDGRVRGVNQSLSQQEGGRNNEWYISMGGNFNERVYLGASIGISAIRYTRASEFVETDRRNTQQYYVDSLTNQFGYPLETQFKSLTYNETLSATGSGINARIGAIFVPIDPLRIGISAQTPTILSMTETYSYAISQDLTEYANGVDPTTGTVLYSQRPSDTISGNYSYRLTTPAKVTAGLMYLFGKSGFLSADVDVMDYSTALFVANADAYSFAQENKNIRDLFQLSYNYRIGGEARLSDMFRLRAGYAFYGSAFTTAANNYTVANGSTRALNTNATFFSLGAGLRQRDFFLDVSYVMQTSQDKFRPYTAGTSLSGVEKYSPTLINNSHRNTATFTLGFYF
jgi:hypothetical protein